MSNSASPSLAKEKAPEEGQVAPKREKEAERPAFATSADIQAKTTVGREGDKRIVEAKETKKVKEQEEIKEIAKKKEKRVVKKKVKRPFSVPNLYWRLAVAGILSLILIGGIFFASGKLKTIVSEIEKRRGQLVALQEKEESLRLLALSLDSAKEEISLVMSALPNEKGVVDFVKQIGHLGDKVAIESLNFESDQPRFDQEGNSYIEWTIEASGSLADVEEFLTRIMNLPILIRPKVIDIDKMDEETSRLVFRAWLYVDPNFFPQRE